MSPCAEFTPLFEARLTDSLSADEAARLETHARSCSACSGALAEATELLGLARLPPLSPVEERAFADLPRRVHTAWDKQLRRRSWLVRGLGLSSSIAAAAAALLIVGSPGKWLFPTTNHANSGNDVTRPVVAMNTNANPNANDDSFDADALVYGSDDSETETGSDTDAELAEADMTLNEPPTGDTGPANPFAGDDAPFLEGDEL
jgi:hypothetical protein